MSSTRWFCHMHSAVAATKATRQMTMPDPELREVLDEAQPVLVRDGSQRGRHRGATAVAALARRALADGVALERRLLALGTPERGLDRRGDRRSAVVVVVVVVVLVALPVIDSLNSRMPVPSCLPRPGSRLGPKIRSTITRTMASSKGPMLGIALFPKVVGRLLPVPANEGSGKDHVTDGSSSSTRRSADLGLAIVMSQPTNSNGQYVRRVTLPSGRSIEVVYFEPLAAEAAGAAAHAAAPSRICTSAPSATATSCTRSTGKRLP